MSRGLTRSNSERFRTENIPANISGTLMLSAFGSLSDNTEHNTLVWVGDGSVSGNYYVLYADNGGAAAFNARDSGGSNNITVGSYSNNVFGHFCGCEVNANSRFAFFNGTKSLENTGSMSASGHDATAIGYHGDSSPGVYMDGDVAIVTIRNRIVSDEQVQCLSDKIHPWLIDPGGIVFHDEC